MEHMPQSSKETLNSFPPTLLQLPLVQNTLIIPGSLQQPPHQSCHLCLHSVCSQYSGQSDHRRAPVRSQHHSSVHTLHQPLNKPRIKAACLTKTYEVQLYQLPLRCPHLQFLKFFFVGYQSLHNNAALLDFCLEC